MRRRTVGAAAAILAGVLAGPVLAQGALAATAHPARPAAYWPVTITIQTVPALPGVHFSVDGTPLTTNGAGVAIYTQQHDFSSHTLRLVDPTIATPLRRYQFSRWAGQRDPNQAFRPLVDGLPMRANYTVTAGFAVQCPVTPKFTSQNGSPLDPRRISRVSLQSSTGRAVSLQPTGTSWLDCLQTVYRNSALATRPISYSVRSVILSGTNIVHADVERFRPDENLTPTVVGYFHTLTIVGHDALFGSSAGGFALVTLPDRSVRRVELGPQHTATLSNLPQGQYQVNLPASGTIAFSESFRLSRAKSVDVTIVSAGDLAAVGGILLLAALGLPLVSRSRRGRLLDMLRRSAEAPGRATALRQRTIALLRRRSSSRLPES
ncbi:MAG: hypothetical protein QOJ73_6643 [Streptosporangiaceae bacterium]|nr:hypothetical protein [Streptosporangiaceae bacterium]